MGTIKVPSLEGATVEKVRPMTKSELRRQGWTPTRYETPIALVFSNGLTIFASRDPEGNGPGVLFGEYDGQGVYVSAEST